jgi:hypothetical protein
LEPLEMGGAGPDLLLDTLEEPDECSEAVLGGRSM